MTTRPGNGTTQQPPILYSGWCGLGWNWTWHFGIYPVAKVKP